MMPNDFGDHMPALIGIKPCKDNPQAKRKKIIELNIERRDADHIGFSIKINHECSVPERQMSLIKSIAAINTVADQWNQKEYLRELFKIALETPEGDNHHE
jgi:hypothetical protein